MGILNYFKRSAQPIDDWVREVYAYREITNSVLSHPIIRRGVLKIADTASQLPLNVYIDGDDGSRDVDTANPIHRQLNLRPSPYCNRSTFIQNLIKDAIIHGNSYHYISSTGDGFIWLDPMATTPDIVHGQLVYKTSINNVSKVLPSHKVLHVKGLTVDTIKGLSLIEQLPDAIYAGLAMYRHIRNYFENSTFSNLIWTAGESIKTDEKFREWADAIRRNYTGNNSAFKNLFLRSGTSVTAMSANNQTSQMKELMEFDITVVAAILGLPPSSLGAAQNSSYASLEIEQQKTLFDINSWLIQIEQEFSSKLMSEDDLLSGKRWIEFNRNALIQTDKSTEMDLLNKGLMSGIYSKEFCRRKLNANIKDSAGETYFHPSNLVPYEGGTLFDLPEPVVAEIQDPVATPVATPNEPEPVQAPDNTAAQRSIVENNLRKMIVRMSKSNKPAKDHLAIWHENLGMLPNNDFVLDQIGAHIDGLNSSKEEVVKNLKLTKWVDLLCQN